ncbi:hypothetical protein [Metallosphaera javensis (ex Sakai et al. 2022)]|uniref:hypothetical protein n=1 Tax=Metallosphaera javensis (ex Sakai et al. 2022) TaxID=2775498 RepID=UPI002590506E|nr:MAG: hypothetical protein MjAS7_0975 [Metallosphaera javensis (ex Sakai et al. 2022)]
MEGVLNISILLILIILLVFNSSMLLVPSAQTNLIPLAQYSYVDLTIQNNQLTSTPSPFQQLVNISESEIGSALFNQIKQDPLSVVFYEPGLGNLPAWLENVTPTYMLWWVKLPYGIPADSSITIYMNVTSQNEYPYTGIDPALDQYYGLPYGEYDNGFYVFLYYFNFINSNGWNETAYFTGYIYHGALLNSSFRNAGIYTKLPFQISNDMSVDIITAYPTTLGLSKEPPIGGRGNFLGPPPETIQNGYIIMFGYFIPFAVIVNDSPRTYGSSYDYSPTWASTYTFQWYNDNLAQFYNFRYIVGITNSTYSGFPYITLLTYQGGTPLVYALDIRYTPPSSVMPTVIVNGIKVSTPHLYTLTFIENDLPFGTPWSVTINGTTKSSTSNEITFSVPMGVYGYSISSPNGFTPNISSGAIYVNENTTIYIKFTQMLYRVEFVESGLPLNTNWSVSINNGEFVNSSTSNEITFSLPLGTYTYAIITSSSYIPSPSSGSFTVTSSPIVITTTLSNQTNGISSTGSGVVSGSHGTVSSNYVILVLVNSAIIAINLIIIVVRRR